MNDNLIFTAQFGTIGSDIESDRKQIYKLACFTNTMSNEKVKENAEIK